MTREHSTSSLSSSDTRPVWIVGAGAVGLTMTTLLSVERPVSLFVRRERRHEFMGAGFRVTGSRVVEARPGAVLVETVDSVRQRHQPVDVWLAVKANDVDSVLAELQPLLTSGSTVVVLSNGLGMYDQVRRSLPAAITVIRGLPSFGAYKLSAFETRLAGDLVFTLAGFNTAQADLTRTMATLSSIGATIAVEHDIALAEWRKAAINLTVNPLCALADANNGALRTNHRLRALLAPLLGEITAVAKHERIPLEPLSVDGLLDRLAPHASNLNSMLIDLRNGRATEIDFITGRFLEVAQRHPVPTPLMRSLYEIIKAVEAKSRSSRAI